MNARKWYLTWEELDSRLRAEALAKLGRLALSKAKYDGTVLPYAWAERIAPLLRYRMIARGRAIWDCTVTLKDRKRGFSIYTLPILDLEAVQ